MVLEALRSFYFLRKSKKVLRQVDLLYQKKAKILDPHAKEKILSHLADLQSAIYAKNRVDASIQMKKLQESSQTLMPRSLFEKWGDFIKALGFALVVAVVIRQMFFELYTIPTGSMRPTLKESDVLLVSKSDFGLNVPLTTSHFYFDPSLVQRGSIVVWTGENMDIPGSDTVYFYLFPGKKQFVKRLIGKPGDTLYFYGGKIYGIDKEGKDLADLRDPKWFDSLEHIPFIRFDGQVSLSSPQGRGVFTKALFRQMNEPIAEITTNPFGFVSGQMLSQNGRAPLDHYSDLWGIKNYGMARLLTEAQAFHMHPKEMKDLEKGLLYLEITHHPSLKDAYLRSDEIGRVRPDLGTSVSLIPLKQSHIDAIGNHMTTCRFHVENSIAFRFESDKKDPFYSRYYPKMDGVPDGTYEILDGSVYKVYMGGVIRAVDRSHPLYKKDPSTIQKLYNMGIEFLTQYEPSKNSQFYPARYTYFRDGALFLLGSPIFEKDDPQLISFLKNEEQKKLLSTSVHPYLPFKDEGAPFMKDGTINANLIRQYGLVIPDKMYLMLGDNHAMSADSRQFGFVPQDNLKGCVGFLLSPPGSRWGRLPQPFQFYGSFPNLFVWGSTIICTAAYFLYRKRRSVLFHNDPKKTFKQDTII